MNPQEFLLYAASFTATWKYLLLFVGIVIEGPLLMVASGFMLHMGVFEPLPLFLVIVAGDLVGDIGWYAVGYYLALPRLEKKGVFMGITREKFEKIKALFHKYHYRILFISKITLGFGLALGTLVVAGATRIPFKKYLHINILGEMVLVGVLLSIGYLFGQLYASIEKDFKIISLVGAVGLSGIILYAVVRFIKSKLNYDKL